MTSRAVIASLATTKRGNPKNYHKIQINSKFNPTQHPKFKQNSHSLNQSPTNRISSNLKSHTTHTKPTQLQNSHDYKFKPRTKASKLTQTPKKTPQPKTHTTTNSNNPKIKQSPQKISLKPISHHQASAIVVKPRVIVAQKALSIELKAFIGKQLCAQSRTHHAFIALIFVF